MNVEHVSVVALIKGGLRVLEVGGVVVDPLLVVLVLVEGVVIGSVVVVGVLPATVIQRRSRHYTSRCPSIGSIVGHLPVWHLGQSQSSSSSVLDLVQDSHVRLN